MVTNSLRVGVFPSKEAVYVVDERTGLGGNNDADLSFCEAGHGNMHFKRRQPCRRGERGGLPCRATTFLSVRDVAAGEDYSVPLLIQWGKPKEGDVRTIWKSRDGSRRSQCAKICPRRSRGSCKTRRLRCPTERPRCFEECRPWRGSPPPDTTFSRVDDSAFDGFRKMATVKTLQLLDSQ